VLPSIGNEVVKAVVAQYNAEQLLTQREKVSREVGGAMCEGRPQLRCTAASAGLGCGRGRGCGQPLCVCVRWARLGLPR
jgi:hypothetical protein